MPTPGSAKPVAVSPRERLVGACITAAGGVAIASLTLLPAAVSRAGAETAEFWCIRCGTFGGVDALLNTLLFLPLGLGLGLRGWRPSRALLAIGALTVAVEALQLWAIPGRDASLSDIVTNTLGGSLGWLLAGQWRHLLFPSPSLARRLGVAALLLWVASRLATAWLLVPSLTDSNWFAQLAPRGVYPADFSEPLQEVLIGGEATPDGSMWRRSRAALESEHSATATFHSPGPSAALASIVSVQDQRFRELLLLGQEGADARFRFRLRAADARLRVPSVRLRGAFTGASPDLVRLHGESTDGRLRLTVESAAGRRTETLDLSAGLTWSLVLPLDAGLGPEARTVTALVTGAALFVVLAFLACGGYALPALTAITLTGISVGLLLPPLLVAVAPASLLEWAGAVCGASLASIIFRRRSRR